MNKISESNLSNEKMAVCYYNKALESAGSDYIGDAVSELKKALNFSPANVAAWNLLGLCYYRLGSYKSAQYCWQQSLDIESEQHNIRRYQQELSVYIDAVAPVINEIEELSERGEYKKAARLIETTLTGDGEPSASLLLYGGIIQSLAGKRSRAAKYWAEAAATDRTNNRVAAYMAQLELMPTFWQNLVGSIKKLLGRRPA